MTNSGKVKIYQPDKESLQRLENKRGGASLQRPVLSMLFVVSVMQDNPWNIMRPMIASANNNKTQFGTKEELVKLYLTSRSNDGVRPIMATDFRHDAISKFLLSLCARRYIR